MCRSLISAFLLVLQFCLLPCATVSSCWIPLQANLAVLGQWPFYHSKPHSATGFPLPLSRAMAHLWSGPFLKSLNVNLDSGYPSSVLTFQLYLDCSGAKSKRIMLKHHTSIDAFKEQPHTPSFLSCSHVLNNVLDRKHCPVALHWQGLGILQGELCKHNPVFVPQELLHRVICHGLRCLILQWKALAI